MRHDVICPCLDRIRSGILITEDRFEINFCRIRRIAAKRFAVQIKRVSVNERIIRCDKQRISIACQHRCGKRPCACTDRVFYGVAVHRDRHTARNTVRIACARINRERIRPCRKISKINGKIVEAVIHRKCTVGSSINAKRVRIGIATVHGNVKQGMIQLDRRRRKRRCSI